MRHLSVSIDPGGTTGFVALYHPSGTIDPNTYTVHTALEVTFNNRFWYRNWLIEHRDQIGVIILERFKLFSNQKTMQAQINSEFPSVRIIGIIEAYAETLALFDRIVFQEPNDRKSAQIPKIHWKALGPSDHVKDAYRHARYHSLTHRGLVL